MRLREIGWLFTVSQCMCLSDTSISCVLFILSSLQLIFHHELIFLLLFCCFQPTVVGEIQSPMGLASVEFIDPREPIAVSNTSLQIQFFN